MATLNYKIDFVFFLAVYGANPNGDPLNGNMPRTDYDGYGEISDVCIKRKVRNRLQNMGYPIFVQSDDRIDDDMKSLEERFQKHFVSELTDEEVVNISCEKWIDVRSFGQVITFKKKSKGNYSIGIRGPVSISIAKSLSPVDVISMQITRSTSGMESKDGSTRSSDTMGTKHYVEFGVYKVKGSINPYFAEKTGFTNDDADLIKDAIRTLFINDASSARPEGSMEVKQIYWFKHPSKIGVTSSARIHELVKIDLKSKDIKPMSFSDYIIELETDKLEQLKDKGLKVEIFEGV